MPEHEAFIRAIAADLYDDAPRLIYADWLDDHGESDRAEFIRVQCELEPIRDLYEINRAAELHRREEDLLRSHQQKWLGQMPKGWNDWLTGASAQFRRGFVDTVLMPVRTFCELGGEVRQLHPTIRRVVMFRVAGYGWQLARCSALHGLAELELACWYTDADAEAIASSPHLGQLQVLELWLGRKHGLTDARLCQIMAESKLWPRLRELTLLNPDGAKERSRKRLVTTANKSAGRKVAVYRRGFPELFPFAADYYYAFPGYLPDGRMAMACEDDRTSPPTLCVITFDRKGNQTDDVITVPFPADLLAMPPQEWYRHKDRIGQHLTGAIGLRPGFIRIRDCHFPGDEYDYNRPHRGHEDRWERLGYPDTDDEASWADDPCGNGGVGIWLVREAQYEFGWDRWADKQGYVHST